MDLLNMELDSDMVSIMDMGISTTPQLSHTLKLLSHITGQSLLSLMNSHIMITMKPLESIDVMYNSMKSHLDMLQPKLMLLRKLMMPPLAIFTMKLIHVMLTGLDIMWRHLTTVTTGLVPTTNLLMLMPNSMDTMVYTEIMETGMDTVTTLLVSVHL